MYYPTKFLLSKITVVITKYLTTNKHSRVKLSGPIFIQHTLLAINADNNVVKNVISSQASTAHFL